MDVSNSNLDETSVQSNQISNCSDFFLYSEKINLSSSKIMPYSPLKMEKFKDKYKVVKRIYANELACAQVVLLEDENGNRFAAKEIFKKKLKNKMFHEFAKNELALQYSLCRLSRNIVKVEEYFEDEEKYLMIMEFSYEPDYFEDLLENQYSAISNEGLLRLYSYDILNAIKDIHENGIIHCDVKPQNFLIFHPDEETEENEMKSESDAEEVDKLKISDFGLAHLLGKDQKKVYMMYRAGTMEYKAPEVKDDCYVDSSIDMWSFGISLYKMAVAYFPTAINRYKYGSGPIPFRPADWRDFEGRELIQDLICKCLKMDPSERITAKEALEHPWFKI